MRCFVAAWPGDATRRDLETLLTSLKPQVAHARPMQPRNLHLTLAFIGELESTAATALARSVDGLSIEPFDWALDSLGWFPRARVAWAGGSNNAALDAAVSTVRALLDAQRVVYDRKPFVAHVTLFRDVRAFEGTGPLPKPLAWRTQRVGLYAAARDDRGPVYRAL